MMLSRFKSFAVVDIFKSIVFFIFAFPIFLQANAGMFLSAIKTGNVEYVDRAIESGVPVNASNGSLMIPLNEAARHNQGEVAELLIRKGADVTTVDSLGQTVVHVAAKHNAVDVLETLYRMKEELGIQVDANAKDNIGIRALYYASEQQESLADTFRFLFKLGADPYLKNGSEGFTALYAAIKADNPRAIREFINIGVDPNRTIGEENFTPLYIAALEDKPRVADALIDNRADPNMRSGAKELTPLYIASLRGHHRVVDVLVQAPNIEIDARNGKWGLTALSTTVLSVDNEGDVENLITDGAHEEKKMDKERIEARILVAALLIDAGADVNVELTKMKMTTLHLAAVSSNFLGILHLLIDAGANVNAKDILRQRPIKYASVGGPREALKILIDAGSKGVLSARVRYACRY